MNDGKRWPPSYRCFMKIVEASKRQENFLINSFLSSNRLIVLYFRFAFIRRTCISVLTFYAL